MTEQGTKELITMMKMSYPASFSNSTLEQIKMMTMLWHGAFKDFPDNVVFEAFTEFFSTSTSHFAPTPAELKQIIANKFKPEESDKTPEEAWTLIEKTMRSADMHYEPSKAFHSLPKLIQKAIGGVSTLKHWSVTDIDRLSYAKRDFISRYKELQAFEDDRLLLPENILQLMDGKSGEEEVLEITGNTVSKPDPGQHMSAFLAELMEFESFSPQKLGELGEI